MLLSKQVEKLTERAKAKILKAVAADPRSQSQIAKDAGIGPTTLNQFLKGTRKFSPEMIDRLAQALKITDLS